MVLDICSSLILLVKNKQTNKTGRVQVREGRNHGAKIEVTGHFG